MSRLIDLIRRQATQSSPPLGFGALVGNVEPGPTLCLIGRSTADTVSDDLDALGPDAVDAVVLDSGDVTSADDGDALADLVWGVGPDVLSRADIETLVEAGCDFFIIDPQNAPASVVSFPDAATIISVDEPLDRETTAAMRALRVDGSLNTSGAVTEQLTFQDLVAVHRVGSTAGGVVLIEHGGELSAAALTALRDAGVDGLVVPLSDAARVARLKQSILEVPPPRRSEARGGQAAVPFSRD